MVWHSFTRSGALLVLGVALGVAGCVSTPDSPDGPIAQLVFASDYRGVESSTTTLSGRYRLDLECSGATELQVQIRVDERAVRELTMPCEHQVTQTVDVSPAVTGDVDLAVEAPGVEGKASLYKA